MIVNLALRLCMVTSVIYCTITEQTQYLWVPVLTMMVFVIRGIVLAERDSEWIAALAEESYFLSFSATLSGVFGLLARNYFAGDAANELRSVEVMGGIGLLTILIGLLTMMTLNDYAQKLEEEELPPTRENLTAAAQPIAATTASTVVATPGDAGFEDVANVNRKVVDLIREVVQRLDKLPGAVDAVVSAMGRVHLSTADFVADVEQMNSVLDEYERLQKRDLDEGMAV